MLRLIFPATLLAFLLTFLHTSNANTVKPVIDEPEPAYVEAHVTTGNYGCGFLLKLNDGQLLLPANLPKKYQVFNEKVQVMFDEVKNVHNSPCNVQKEVHIAKIRAYEPNAICRAKY
ncbi:MAG TPA: hypothetical protein VGF30_00510 [Bacteroidia bacterium]